VTEHGDEGRPGPGAATGADGLRGVPGIGAAADAHGVPGASATDDRRDSARSRFEQTAALFERIRAAPREDRTRLLRSLCNGDASIESELRTLLAYHEAEADLLDAGILRPRSSRIGPYRLERRLGEGGMGAVWLARQSEPVARDVALKLIKSGMDTKAVVRRFEVERRVLARLEHPGIARVLEVGSTPEGRPYFAMEYVRGAPLLEWCDERRMDLPSRLRLFIEICRAVEHAHRKGVLHRDLKPSNVLVTEVDGRPVPKVIDFGVAKLLDDPGLAGQTVLTQAGSVVGTPDYMSPEQAVIGGDVDTRSDVYSLGVMLYELLTGLTPRRAASSASRRPTLGTISGMLRSGAPMRPSSAIDQGEPPIAEHAARLRSTDARSLRRYLAADLDWIVLRAIETEPDRRYGSVDALERDVARALASEPVEARPPSLLYLSRRFAQRHARSLIAAGFVIGAILTGMALALVGWSEARQERDAAVEARERERQTSHRLADKLHESQVDRGRTALQSGLARDARQLLWSSFLDRPDSVLARWGLRESMLRQRCASSAGFFDTHPMCVTLIDDAHALVGVRGAPPAIVALESGRITTSLDGPAIDAREVAIDSSGRWVMAACDDGTVHGWELATGRALGAIIAHGAGPAAVAPFGGEGRFLTGGVDGAVTLVQVPDGATQVLLAAPAASSGTASNEVGESVASDASANSARVTARAGAIRRLASHPNGAWALGRTDGRVVLVDADGVATELEPNRGDITTLRFSGSGRRLGSGCTGHELKIHDAVGARTVASHMIGGGTVRDLAFMPGHEESVLLAGWWDISIIDLRDGSIQRSLDDSCWRFALSSDGRAITTVTGSSGMVRQFDLAPWRLSRREWAEGLSTKPAWSPTDLRTLVTAGRRLQALRHDGMSDWTCDFDAAITGLAIAEDRSLSAVVTRDGRVTIVGEDGVPAATFDRAAPGHRNAVSVHAGRRLVAYSCADGGVLLRSIDDGFVSHLLPSDPRGVLAVEFDPAGRRLAVSTRETRTHLFDLDESVSRLLITPSTIFDLAFPMNGSRLFEGSWRGWLEIADLPPLAPNSACGASPPAALMQVHPSEAPSTIPFRGYRGHGRMVGCVTAHPADPAIVATGDVDGIVRFWHLDLGLCLLSIAPFEPATSVQSIQMSLDGDAVRVIGADGQIAGWSWSELDRWIVANRAMEEELLQREPRVR